MKKLLIVDLILIWLLSLFVILHMINVINDTIVAVIGIPLLIYFVILQKMIRKRLRNYVKEEVRDK